jgi:hypothetical protein
VVGHGAVGEVEAFEVLNCCCLISSLQHASCQMIDMHI